MAGGFGTDKPTQNLAALCRRSAGEILTHDKLVAGGFGTDNPTQNLAALCKRIAERALPDVMPDVDPPVARGFPRYATGIVSRAEQFVLESLDHALWKHFSAESLG